MEKYKQENEKLIQKINNYKEMLNKSKEKQDRPCDYHFLVRYAAQLRNRFPSQVSPLSYLISQIRGFAMHCFAFTDVVVTILDDVFINF